MPYFNFSQNITGGSFHFSESGGITVHVVVEAKDSESANATAMSKGVYFDGVDSGKDCGCCGDRWDRAELGGWEQPSVYGRPLGRKDDSNRPSVFWANLDRQIAVHHADGRIEWFNADKTKAAAT